MKKVQVKYSLLLALGALIWGLAFVAQSKGMDYVGPFTFNGLRSFIGAAVLAPFATLIDIKEGVLTSWKSKKLWVAGLVCGVVLFLATSSQQIGIVSTSAGKSGFITSLYIVLVPIFSLALRKKPGKFIWISISLALVGLYFLCVSDTFSLQLTDLWLFACAALFALQIIAVDVFAPDLDVIKLSCLQFLVTGVLSIIPLITERPQMSAIQGCLVPLLYAGVFSSGVAYTLQMEGQKRVDASVASLIMSLESVFSAVFGFIILHERLSARELTGCIIMFTAVILAQLVPQKKGELGDRKKAK